MEKIKRKNRGSDLAMTTEQREAIDRLNRFKTIQVLYGNTFAMHIEQLKTLQVNINTVLSLIKEQQEEIVKKDKQIDLMAYTLQDNLYLTPLDGLNKEELKQYFETKAKKGE